jgi:V/A-type H+-transporting ATPase subunit I
MKVAMAHLQIIGLKDCLMPVVHRLYELGCVQMEALSESGMARPLEPEREMVQQREGLAYLATQIEGVLAVLTEVRPNLATAVPITDGNCFEQAEAGVNVLLPQVQALAARRQALAAEQSSLPRYEATLRRLLPVVPAAAREPDNSYVGVLVSRDHRWVLDEVAEEVLKLTAGRAAVGAGDLDSGTRAMVIVVPRTFATEVERLLGREDISRLRLPEEISGLPPDAAVVALGRRLAAIPHELAQIEAELAAVAESWLPRLVQWRTCLRGRLAEMDVLGYLGETDYTFILTGWTPAANVERLRNSLAALGDGLVVEVLPLTAADQERAPVLLLNPAVARPFESLVRLLNLPRYQDVDPTLLMALFLPLFFGMILGDVGYGGLLLLLCLVGLRRFRQAGIRRDLVKVLTLGAGWSIVFGFLYGEAFGTLGERWGMHAIWLERASSEQVVSLLLFTIGVGALHVTLGLILGVWEAVRERSRHHLLERGGMLIGLIGLFVLVSTVVKWLPEGAMTPGAAVLIVGIVLLSSSQGWLGLLLGPIEFIGLIGNILSYLRIAAVGLASVYVARLANDLAGSLGSVLVGAIVAILIHALNLVLGVFSPTIHSLRLHYVEFFRKFYEGGGRPFAPFQRSPVEPGPALQGESYGR